MTQPAYLADLERRVVSRAAKASRTAWPSPKYEDDPVAFAREVVDTDPWPEQERWMAACAVPDAHVSVVSGNKTGKSRGEAAIALWAWATFDPVRVFLFAPKIEHIEKIALWPETRALFRNSGRCKACRAREHVACDHTEGVWRCKPQDPCPWCSPLGPVEMWNEDPTIGLRSPDGRREILAYTARDLDAMGGISGPKLFFLFDESGGIKSPFFEAMKGNSAGGVTWIMTGNPLHTVGEQYDAHHGKRKLYSHVQEISALDTPNVKAGKKIIPGLATRDWVARCAEDWGVDSSLYMIRVLGQYPRYEPGQLLRVDQVEKAFAMWKHAPFTGRLQIGVDVAFRCDDAAIAPRRGYRISEVRAFTNTDADSLADEVAHVARDLREPHEQRPVVTFDAQGATGADFGRSIRRYESELEIIPVYGNGRPRDPRRYYQRRDEIAHQFAAWVKRGGALPYDPKLEGELMRLVAKPYSATDQRAKTLTNLETKALLGRSPDRRDACMFACTDPTDELELAKAHANTLPSDRADRSPPVDQHGPETEASPYGAADAGMRQAWGQR